MRSARIAGLIASSAALAVIGCGGARPVAPARTPAPAPAPASAPSIEGPTRDISQLYGEIRGWRRDLGLEAEPHVQMGRIDMCEPTGDTCGDVCTLADHICENSADICSIANDLSNDRSYGWARDKCNSAKLSCNEARQKCCSCVHGEKAPSNRWEY